MVDFFESLNFSQSLKSYLLNFSRNKCALFINSVVIGDYLYVKLYEPLDDSIETDFKITPLRF